MNTTTYITHIETDGRALIEAVAAAPEAQVQACPRWTTRDLAKHLGGVYAFVIAQLHAGNPESRAPSNAPEAPETGDITPWLRDRHQDVLAAPPRIYCYICGDVVEKALPVMATLT